MRVLFVRTYQQNLSLLIIIILLHYATQRHGIEDRARQEKHDRSIEFLEQVSGRTRIAIKHIKNVLFPQINKSLIITYLGYNNIRLKAPRMTQK